MKMRQKYNLLSSFVLLLHLLIAYSFVSVAKAKEEMKLKHHIPDKESLKAHARLLEQKILEAVNSEHIVTDTTELVVMDYVISAFEGFKADEFVPGSMNCVYLSKFTQIDMMRMITYLKTEPHENRE